MSLTGHYLSFDTV